MILDHKKDYKQVDAKTKFNFLKNDLNSASQINHNQYSSKMNDDKLKLIAMETDSTNDGENNLYSSLCNMNEKLIFEKFEQKSNVKRSFEDFY